MDAPPHDRQRGQQTNHRAGYRGGGGVTQVRVAALEGKTGDLERIKDEHLNILIPRKFDQSARLGIL